MKDVHTYCDACHVEIMTAQAEVHYRDYSAVAGCIDGEVVEPLDGLPRELDFHLACLLSLDIEPAYKVVVRPRLTTRSGTVGTGR